MQPDLPELPDAPPALTHPGPCGLCGCEGPMHGVAHRSLISTMRKSIGALPGEQLVLFVDPLAPPPPVRRAPRSSTYLPLTYDPTADLPPAPPAPTVGLCYRHTVVVVQLMRYWGEPPDGYAWVPDGLLTP